MSWLQLDIRCPKTQAEIISGYLQLFDAQAITVTDAKDQPIYEPKPGHMPLWDNVIVTALFPDNTDIQAIIHWLKQQSFYHEKMTFESNPLSESDWQNKWQQNQHPLYFADRLAIYPSHIATNNQYTNVILDGGLAFGTGRHPTTALCLEWLANNIKPNTIIIDYGCGSGILAIAAIKLGAKQVYAVDYDPQALTACQQNMDKNQISDQKIIMVKPEDLPNIKADVIIANILANPLIELAPRFASSLNKAGKLVLSGILSEQSKDLKQAYDENFIFNNIKQREDWICIDLQKR